MASKKTSSKKPASKNLSIKLWVYMSNCGDGSAAPKFFNTEQEAEDFAEPDGERFCDDIFQTTLRLDPKTLKLLKVPTRDEDGYEV
jgi:hypothetical protein